jgi:hypothetical protein
MLLTLAAEMYAMPSPFAQESTDVGNSPLAHYAAAAPASDATTGSLHVQGDAQAMKVEVRRTTIGDVLLKLAAAFDVSYRAAVPLNDELSGTYAGSLGYVIARLLDGYDYVIRREGSSFDITILERVGGEAVVAPRQHPVSQHRAQLRASHH